VTGQPTSARQTGSCRRRAVLAIGGMLVTLVAVGAVVRAFERRACEKQVARWYVLSAGATAIAPGMSGASVRVLMGDPDRVVPSESNAVPPGSVEWHYDTPDPSCGGGTCFIRLRLTPAAVVFGRPRDGCILMSSD
jgi:hypothetical protein